MTAPPASRQNVAVSSSLCSSGCCAGERRRRTIAAPFDGRPAAPALLRRMFDHVTLRTADFAAATQAYRRLLGVLGSAPCDEEDWLVEWEDFGLSPADGEHPATTGAHVGLVAPSREVVDAFWRAGVAAG